MNSKTNNKNYNYNNTETSSIKEIITNIFFKFLVKKTTEEKTSDLFTPDAIAISISDFINNPEEGITFHWYYRRFEEIFKKDYSHWNDEKKIRLLLRKLSTSEHEKYAKPAHWPNG